MAVKQTYSVELHNVDGTISMHGYGSTIEKAVDDAVARTQDLGHAIGTWQLHAIHILVT